MEILLKILEIAGNLLVVYVVWKLNVVHKQFNSKMDKALISERASGKAEGKAEAEEIKKSKKE